MLTYRTGIYTPMCRACLCVDLASSGEVIPGTCDILLRQEQVVIHNLWPTPEVTCRRNEINFWSFSAVKIAEDQLLFIH
jgi:hypothetical protein